MPIVANFVEKNYMVSFIEDEALDPSLGIDFVKSSKCGAINTFFGCIRDTDYMIGESGRTLSPLQAIYYDSYIAMALKQVVAIVCQELNHPKDLQDPNSRAYVGIRLGRVPIQETAIIISVSSTGREFASKSTLSMLEKIKASVPIWKKLIFSNGAEQWVKA